MNSHFLGAGLGVFSLFLSFGSAAEAPQAADSDEHHITDEIIVAATPLQRTVEQLAQPTSVLFGDALARNQSSSIGETLADQLGMSATYFGPIASRPVIRGQFGERVRVLSNGLDALDASALSEDHAVSLDSILADRVEIVRGPATLLYGSGAAGGLVNIVDSRIHEQPLDVPMSGAVSLGSDSAIGKTSGAFKFDIGSESLSLHLDGFRRDTDDIEIPGYAESAVLRALEEESGDAENDAEAFGTVENTDSETRGGAAGLTWNGRRGFLGLSVSQYDSNYGIPVAHEHDEEEAEEEETIRIDLEQTRYDLRGQIDFAGFVKSLSVRLAQNDYMHIELEGEATGTVFDTEGTDARIELRHAPIGLFEGAIGLQYKNIDFAAIGDEAFVPPSDTRQLSLFLFEELRLTDSLVFQASARAENQAITSPGLPKYDDWAYGASLGALWTVTPALKFSPNLSITERHPNSTELYANGPHLAVQRFERGSVTLGAGLLSKETSANLDLSLRGAWDRWELGVTGFVNRVDDYVLLRPTTEIEDGLQVFDFTQTDVELIGYEAELLFDIVETNAGHLHTRLSSDYVRAEERTSGANLPRIPPLRYGLGLHYAHSAFDASVEAIHHEAQDRVAENELPTDSYTMLNAELSKRFADDTLLMFVRGTNLGDEDARRHTSPVKDIVPLPGRSLHLGLRWDF